MLVRALPEHFGFVLRWVCERARNQELIDKKSFPSNALVLVSVARNIVSLCALASPPTHIPEIVLTPMEAADRVCGRDGGGTLDALDCGTTSEAALVRGVAVVPGLVTS